MPRIGLGMWQIPDSQAADTVRIAVAAGYRLFDTAARYGNEKGLGEGIRRAGLPRAELFVTTKLGRDRMGSVDEVMRACNESRARLGLDQIDLYLIHWPQPASDTYVQCWRALIRLREQGQALSIGVCNFNRAQLERIIAETGVVPAVNQIELHPRFQQSALRAFHEERDIATEAWTPLGGDLREVAPVRALAAKYGRTPAQIILRWHIETGVIPIPRSGNAGRIVENFRIFDFALEPPDLELLSALDDPAGRTGPDPRDVN